MADTTYLNPKAAQAALIDETSRPSHRPLNVGETERWASGAGGGLLLLLGLRQGGLGGLATAALGGMLVYRGVTGHCSMYQAIGMNTSEEGQGAAGSVPAQQGTKVETSITINKPREELFAYWRNFENLPRFMRHLKSVTVLDGTRSRWVASAPMGSSVEWDAEIHNERPNELIAWRSLEGSQVDTAGSVHFAQAPGNRGTELRVSLKYNPPAGKLGIAIAKLFGESARQQIEEDLRRFKQIMEAGEIATVEGQPSARKS